MKLVKAILIAFLFIFAVTFAMENNDIVSIHYYNFIESVPIPVFLIVLISIAIGILLVGFLGIFERFQLTIKLKKQGKKIKTLEKELNHLRNFSRAKTDDIILKKEM